jgi:hypothetical protein
MPGDRIPTDLFTAKGEPVLVTQLCNRCGHMKPLAAFGLRRIGGKLRSIATCKTCRGAYPRRQP